MIEAINLARQKKLPFRINRGQVIDHTILVKNEDGSNYDFSGHTAEMYVYNSYNKTSTPEYTITVTLSSGEIHFDHAAINILREELVYKLWITNASAYRQPWLNGPFLILNREWDHEDGQDTLTISPNGDTITLDVSVGNSVVKSVEYTLSSSQILDLHNTTIQYLSPVGEDKYAVPISCEYIHMFGTVPYTRINSAQVNHFWDSVTSAGLAAGGMLTTSFNSVSNVFSEGSLSATNINLIVNKGLFVRVSPSTSFTLGDGSLKIKVKYYIVTV